MVPWPVVEGLLVLLEVVIVTAVVVSAVVVISHCCLLWFNRGQRQRNVEINWENEIIYRSNSNSSEIYTYGSCTTRDKPLLPVSVYSIRASSSYKVFNQFMMHMYGIINKV